jgi:hypothetical protein
MGCKQRQQADSQRPAGIVWGIIVVAMSSPGLADEPTDSAQPALWEQAIACVQDSITRSPGPWPDAWRQEYTETIREVVTSHQQTPYYDRQLVILCNGFRPYWEGLKKGQDRSLFEVHCAEICWYVESLMDANFPGEEQMRALRNQYADLFHFAASSLLTQFPFLDPNAVHKAEADHLADCYRRIEAPLLPIYLHPFSQAQLEQIKQRWHDLRYARVDLWRQLGGDDTPRTRNLAPSSEQAKPSKDHPDYLLARRSLSLLHGPIWDTVGAPPEYYRAAVANHIDAQKRRVQSRAEASAAERRLEREYSRQIFQTEQIAFLMGALLESPPCFEETSLGKAGENTLPDAASSATEGGNAHGGE